MQLGATVVLVGEGRASIRKLLAVALAIVSTPSLLEAGQIERREEQLGRTEQFREQLFNMRAALLKSEPRALPGYCQAIFGGGYEPDEFRWFGRTGLSKEQIDECHHAAQRWNAAESKLGNTWYNHGKTKTFSDYFSAAKEHYWKTFEADNGSAIKVDMDQLTPVESMARDSQGQRDWQGVQAYIYFDPLGHNGGRISLLDLDEITFNCKGTYEGHYLSRDRLSAGWIPMPPRSIMKAVANELCALQDMLMRDLAANATKRREELIRQFANESTNEPKALSVETTSSNPPVPVQVQEDLPQLVRVTPPVPLPLPPRIIPPRASTTLLVREKDYPPEALRLREQGNVGVKYVVQVDGKIGECSVSRPSGKQRLDVAACDIARQQWQYRPATQAGVPIEYTMESLVPFRLP